MGSAQESISIRCMLFVLLASQYIFIGEARHESLGEKKVLDRRMGQPVSGRTARWRDYGASRMMGRRTGWSHARGGRMKREGNGKRQLGGRESDE